MAAGETVFRFTAEGVDLEFAGSEAFVEKQLVRFQAFLKGAVGTPEPVAAVAAAPGAAAKPGAAPASSAPKEALESFYAARPLREGRGAIQDRILLFIYYLQQVQEKREVSGDDILWCFQQLGITEPKNLHNALGILKRKIGHLQEGTKRGLYALSTDGAAYIEGRFRSR
jgi:hypothetical protein